MLQVAEMVNGREMKPFPVDYEVVLPGAQRGVLEGLSTPNYMATTRKDPSTFARAPQVVSVVS